MYIKIHISQKSKIIAICDEDLVGKVLKEKDICMDLSRYKGFYVGEKTNLEGAKKELKKGFSSLNIVGSESIKATIEAEVIDESEIRYVNKIPYIQVYQI